MRVIRNIVIVVTTGCSGAPAPAPVATAPTTVATLPTIDAPIDAAPIDAAVDAAPIDAAPVAAEAVAFSAADLAKLAAGTVLAYDGTHFAYLARHNGNEAYVALDRYELADRKGERVKALIKIKIPFDTPVNIAKTIKPTEAKVLAALAGYQVIEGVALTKKATLPSGATVSANDATIIFTPVPGKPVKRRLDGGGVTTPEAHYAFELPNETRTVIVTTSYTGDVVFAPGFEMFR